MAWPLRVVFIVEYGFYIVIYKGEVNKFVN